VAAREDPEPVPLSVSPLWSLLRASYESGDTEAWDDGSIPTYITSNAALAHRYSRVLLGWIRDLEAAGKLVPSEPLRILELGCGTGRFTFQMLQALEELETSPALRLLDWSYVATDLSEKRLSRLQRVAPLQRFISDRRLKTAFYDALADNPALQNSNSGPLVVIANYVFDSLPADCFRVHGGQLFETRIRSHQEDTDQGLKGVSWQFSHHRIALPHYGDRDLDRILERCKARGLPKTILIPIGTVRALRNLQALTLGVRSRHLMVWIEGKSVWFFLPGFADELIDGKAMEGLESFCEVIGSDEVVEVSS
jgi:SAM-dependent methyltransferase